MGLFDDLGGSQGIGLGLAGAGGAMERGAAALQGRLPQYDEAQVDIAGKKAALFKGILTEIEDLALSSVDDPNIIGPKLKQFQAIAKQAGINLDDNLIDHFTNNPMSLGMTFDPELTKGMTPQQTQILKRLQVEATRAGPRQMQAITKLDEIRATRMTQAVQEQVKELRAVDPSLGVKEAYIEAMKGKSYTTSPKLMADALKMMQGSDLELAEVMKSESSGQPTLFKLHLEAAKKLYRGDVLKQREAIDDWSSKGQGWQNDVYDRLKKENKGDPALAEKKFAEFMGSTTAERARQGEEAKLGVRASSRYQAVEAQLARLRSENRTAGTALPEGADQYITSSLNILDTAAKINPKDPKSLYKPEFVGPIRNYIAKWKESYGETPGIETILGGAMSPEETKFRNNAEFIFNEIANLRGGKVLPAQELDRIQKEAIALFASPTAFEARYEAFTDRLATQLENKIKTIQTTRGNAGGLVPGRQPATPSANAPASNVPPFSIDVRPGAPTAGRKVIMNMTDRSTWSVPEKTTREQMQMIQEWFAGKEVKESKGPSQSEIDAAKKRLGIP